MGITKEELNTLVSGMDLAKIREGLEKCGYRHASQYGVWEFSPTVVWGAKCATETETFEDVFGDVAYSGEIYACVEGYEGIEFIVITVDKIYREKDNFSFPEQMLLFTNAPVNTEHEKKMLRPCPCSLCKRTFAFGELVTVNDKILCDDCFMEDVRRVVAGKKSKIVRKVKKTKKK